jgi:AraC-like DNA-binding protein
VSLDVLGEILATLEWSSQLYFRAELGPPFGITVPERRGVIRFHVAAAGSCAIHVEGTEPVRLAPGDLVLVPHGAAHVLTDVAGRPAVPLSRVLADAGFDGTGPLVLGGGDGPSTVLVCGHFAFAGALLPPLLAALPPLLHVRAEDGGSYAWMEHVLRRLEAEARTRATGHVEVVRRLSEILLIEVLRGSGESGEPGFLSAMMDPQLGRALQAIHAEPEAAWSLGELAGLAGHSRTCFVERFRECIGMSPMKYLASWRLLKARHLLGCSEQPVSEVARRVGYRSESAFNRAFREQFGVPPGQFRRTRPPASEFRSIGQEPRTLAQSRRGSAASTSSSGPHELAHRRSER